MQEFFLMDIIYVLKFSMSDDTEFCFALFAKSPMPALVCQRC
jgi:hypothetical protein